MTDMQLIIRLGQDDGSPIRDMGRNEIHGDFEDRSTGNNHESIGSSCEVEGVLSQELRESFEAMKAVWRETGRSTGEDSAAKEELKRKTRQQATETALAVESEVLQWQNGIAELEALLAAEDDDSDEGGYEEDETSEEFVYPRPRGHAAAVVPFPVLPPVIVPDDYDDDGTSSDISQSGSESNLVRLSET